MQRILFTKDQSQMITAFGSMTEGAEGKFYHLPAVYLQVGNNLFMELSKEELPIDVKYRLFPELKPEATEYVMGVDPCGYDGNICTVMVMKKQDGEVVAHYKGRPEPDFDAMVDKLKSFYKIPDNQILKEL